ncbi:MAG: glycosyltransferase N-terminal domain-containing protein, partial [Amylibacter sp.]
MFGRTELWIYLLTSRMVGNKLIQKLKTGAEEAGISSDRFQERLGVATVPRKAGRLVWLHTSDAVSALPLLGLIEQLNEQELDLRFLVTTRKQEKVDELLDQLPVNTVHQYLPIDLDQPIQAFLKYWAPDVAVISEGEFWPRFLTKLSKQRIPLIAINTRMSNKS